MEPEKKSNGAFVGLVIIIIILILGGIYIWQSKVKSVLKQKEATESQTTNQSAGIITNDDASALDALNQDIQNVDPGTGVDVNAIQ